MIGTYSTLPEVNWAVIAQRSLDQAQSDTGVTELNRQALAFVIVVILSAILVGYFFAVGISGPIRGLPRPRARSAAANFTSAHPSAALRKSASSLKISTRWPATSRSTSSA